MALMPVPPMSIDSVMGEPPEPWGDRLVAAVLRGA
jgi:hypothetical protein